MPVASPLRLRIEQEQAALDKAESYIVAGERRVTEQMERIAQLEADGHDIGLAERTLRNLQDTLEQWRAHREAILAELDRLRGGRGRAD